MVICLERGADLHLAQLMPMPLTVSCFRKIQIGSTFLVPAHLGSLGKRAVKWACVCYCHSDVIVVQSWLTFRIEFSTISISLIFRILKTERTASFCNLAYLWHPFVITLYQLYS